VVDGAYEKVPETREDNWVWSPQGAIDMHRPERWGYVQFSTAPAGTAAFRPDPAAPARDLLIRVYQAQRAHHATHDGWAGSVDALGVELPDDVPVPRLELTPDGFEASVVVPGVGEEPARRWTIRQDSRIWSEDVDPKGQGDRD
jgi:hypothetical protein